MECNLLFILVILLFFPAEVCSAFSQAEACIDSFSVFSRNARIARLKLYASYPIESADIKAKLSVASQEHFTDFSTKYVCFLDLSPYLPSLRAEHKVELVNFAAQHARSLTPGPNDPEVSLSRLSRLYSLTCQKGQSHSMDYFRGQSAKATL